MELEHKPNEVQTAPEVQPPEAMAPMVQAIGPQQLKKFTQVLEKYKAGKTQTESRILASENWWKLRNTMEEQKASHIGGDGFKSVSGWLHNVIVLFSKVFGVPRTFLQKGSWRVKSSALVAPRKERNPP